VERNVRKPGRAVRGSPAPHMATCGGANATGIGWCQRVAGRKPHSRARDDSSTGCARASTSVAEVDERRQGPEKRDPDGKRACGRGPGSRRAPQGANRGINGVDDRHRGGQAAEPGEARAGRSKGRCGAEVFVRRKALQVAIWAGSFTRVGLGRPRRLLR